MREGFTLFQAKGFYNGGRFYTLWAKDFCNEGSFTLSELRVFAKREVFHSWS
jgi:hypothetical protein